MDDYGEIGQFMDELERDEDLETYTLNKRVFSETSLFLSYLTLIKP